jgi:hypothetical protein
LYPPLFAKQPLVGGDGGKPTGKDPSVFASCVSKPQKVTKECKKKFIPTKSQQPAKSFAITASWAALASWAVLASYF